MRQGISNSTQTHLKSEPLEVLTSTFQLLGELIQILDDGSNMRAIGREASEKTFREMVVVGAERWPIMPNAEDHVGSIQQWNMHRSRGLSVHRIVTHQGIYVDNS